MSDFDLGPCQCCNDKDRPAIGVAGSTFGAFSVAYCVRCAREGIEPYWACIATVAMAAGDSFEGLADWAIERIKRSLVVHGKTEADLFADVKKDREENEKDATIARLTAERDRLVDGYTRVSDECVAALNQRDQARADVERLTKERDEARAERETFSYALNRIAAAAKVLAEFARTAPGRLPSHIGDALMIVDPTGRRE